jgi:Arc/MetJ-type ribon-helix-helix transcriptional regulator
MTIHLPRDVESSIEAAVQSGRFASVDAAITEAARLLLRELAHEPQLAGATAKASVPDPLLGLMRDDVELMDEIVADAYRRRREETWREVDL